MTLGARRRRGKVHDAEVGDVKVQRLAVRAKELAQLCVGGLEAAFGERRDAGSVSSPRGESALLHRVEDSQGSR